MNTLRLEAGERADAHQSSYQLVSARRRRARGFEPVIYEEVESAAKARPVFACMIADARAGRVWVLDRLHRSMVGAIQTVLELDRIGILVISVRKPLAR